MRSAPLRRRAAQGKSPRNSQAVDYKYFSITSQRAARSPCLAGFAAAPRGVLLMGCAPGPRAARQVLAPIRPGIHRALTERRAQANEGLRRAAELEIDRRRHTRR